MAQFSEREQAEREFLARMKAIQTANEGRAEATPRSGNAQANDLTRRAAQRQSVESTERGRLGLVSQAGAQDYESEQQQKERDIEQSRSRKESKGWAWEAGLGALG